MVCALMESGQTNAMYKRRIGQGLFVYLNGSDRFETMYYSKRYLEQEAVLSICLEFQALLHVILIASIAAWQRYLD
jgi:hypothetical protein